MERVISVAMYGHVRQAITPTEKKRREEQEKKAILTLRFQKAVGALAVEIGDVAAAQQTGVASHTAKYYRHKLEQPLLHPGTHGGYR